MKGNPEAVAARRRRRRPAAFASVLLLCSDDALARSLADLLNSAGYAVVDRELPRGGRVESVIADCDAWPLGWDLARLRRSFRDTDCFLLSASPMAGPFTVTGLPRGYFLPLPVLPRELLARLQEASGAELG